MMEPYDKQLEIAADREFQSDVENGRRLVAESNQPDNLKTRTEEWKKSIPHTLPPDADYDYMSMVRDGKQPSMSHKPADWNDAEQGEWKPEPVFLPHEYYRGSLVTSRKGGTGRLVQKQYNLNSGKMELSLPFSRVVARGIEDIGTGLVNMAYDAGTLAALPVDVAKETAKAAARSTPFTAGAMAKMDVEAGTPERERPTLGAMFDSWENAAAEGRLDEYQNTPWEIARDDMFERYDWERPKIGDTEVYGLGEEMSSLMLTIVGDFAIGGKMAGQRSVSADAGKLKAFTEMLIDNLKTGVYGEYLFSHVDEEGGNISSLLRDFGFDNAVTEALDTRGMDNDAMRIALNTAEGAMLSSLWHFAKITKDVALQAKIQERAAIVAGRIMENIGGGPVAGSPRAQRGAIGDLSQTGSGARSIGTHATAEEITQLDPGRPIYVAQSNPGELSGGINTRPVQHEVFLKPGAKQVNVMDEDLRMAWYDDAGEEAGYAKLRAKYPDADVLVGDNGTTLIMNPDMIELGAAIKQTPEQIAAARESMNQMRTFKMDEVLAEVDEIPSARAATIEPTGREMSFDERLDKYLTDEEKALMTAKDRESMQRLLTVAASPEEVASMAAAGGSKRGWYSESAAALRHIFGDDADRFAMLLSATSPQTSVESNLRNALNIWKNWTAAGRPSNIDEIKRIMGDSVEGDKGEDSVLGAWINNSARALSDPNSMPIRISGPKVNSFWRNLMGQLGEVTQDTWMARALGMSQARDFSGRNLKAFADEIGSLGQKKSGYLAGNLLVREAADIMSRATGETWTPAEVQETVWSWAKAIYEAKGGAGETRNIPEILRSGEITDDVVRDTPDFATLFGQEGEFRRILENAGYGQQIENLPASGFGSRSAIGLGAEGERALESAARRLDRTSRARRKGTSEDIYQWSRGLIRPVGDPGSTPGTFGRRNLRTGTGSLSDIPVTQFYLPKEKQAQLQKLGVPTPSLNEFSAPEKFHEFVSQAKANSKDTSGFLTLYSPEEYANMRTFVTSDGSAGFAIKPDGDIVSVFNNKAGPNKGISPHLISLAIEQGGTKLDAYDGILMDIYGDMGFVEVGRDKWNPKYKPDDWNEERFGTPDVVYMELQK